MTLAETEERVALKLVSSWASESRRIEKRLVDSVSRCRVLGCNWPSIAQALGITPEGARSRFSRRVARVDLRKDRSRYPKAT